MYKRKIKLFAPFAGLLLCLVLPACTGKKNKEKDAGAPFSYRIEVFESDSAGYGYKIFENERLFIMQPFVPGISGKRSFRNKTDAQKVAEVVVKRMKAGELYSIFEADLDSLNITY